MKQVLPLSPVRGFFLFLQCFHCALASLTIVLSTLFVAKNKSPNRFSIRRRRRRLSHNLLKNWQQRSLPSSSWSSFLRTCATQRRSWVAWGGKLGWPEFNGNLSLINRNSCQELETHWLMVHAPSTPSFNSRSITESSRAVTVPENCTNHNKSTKLCWKPTTFPSLSLSHCRPQ